MSTSRVFNKPISKTSQLTNDSGFISQELDPTVPSWAKQSTKPTYTAAEVGATTTSDVNTLIASAIGNISSFDVELVQSLPTQNIKEHTIYFVPKTGETNDVYDEYIYINNTWEMIGNTQIDLSTKADKTDTVLNTTLSRGRKNNSAVGVGSFAFGDDVRATGNYSHAEGSGTVASGAYSHAEGSYTMASFGESHAEGSGSTAGNNCAHAEGSSTIATGHAAHAEGNSTEASGSESHSEGYSTQANGYASHSEGEGTIANAYASHVGGQYNIADGYDDWESGKLYHIGDKVQKEFPWATNYFICTVENSDEEFNYNNWNDIGSNLNYVEIIGNGTDDENRSNAYALDWNGNGHFSGEIYVNCNSDSTGGAKLLSANLIASAAETEAIISGYGRSEELDEP